ncbi:MULTISPECIES: 2Fe-2S iron-sulfur cluster-binding protein [unclassified Pseudomonas]|uniref:2Fe-2S iron-sulfur cluster-binding protein n=1 Tax=unclassified Pseudomonas TaxID=196821 RepID=UPI000C884D26|nr:MULTISPECIES: 2Fe-2S iron-sulfur cluster-binding protein [unclassified Pseudomonas]PMX27445.1 (2Fe-2S)-binding protein [Pseudomonas sp. GW460-12]PMX34487.1 (2Fe-2S)-binding protein [Pseudomonas sp. MPR-R2A4]PMX41895.1 (2Fe-2S)-binding protein [Pseudomonas sp. MPR-R2A7]PMX53850.1 (2Fe-2S)-binding protein [Pseudomonas sp. MPR-R2A6]PMX91331.1 (2Fe-2S)-binding protein [Pseudomonas sp. MPR-R2A3]
MSKVIFIESNDTVHSVDAESGRSLMQIAQDNLMPGIYGECGGACSCATCHVYVDPAWEGRLPPRSSDETLMLEGAVHVNEHSRLCCQLTMRDEWEGLVLRIPVSQG